MSQRDNSAPKDETRDEYDFSGGVRGKFYNEYMKGTNVVLLDAETVNQALRTLISIARTKLPQSR